MTNCHRGVRSPCFVILGTSASNPTDPHPDYTDYRYLGKEGKQHVVTSGLSTHYLSNREFREFSANCSTVERLH